MSSAVNSGVLYACFRDGIGLDQIAASIPNSRATLRENVLLRAFLHLFHFREQKKPFEKGPEKRHPYGSPSGDVVDRYTISARCEIGPALPCTSSPGRCGCRRAPPDLPFSEGAGDRLAAKRCCQEWLASEWLDGGVAAKKFRTGPPDAIRTGPYRSPSPNSASARRRLGQTHYNMNATTRATEDAATGLTIRRLGWPTISRSGIRCRTAAFEKKHLFAPCVLNETASFYEHLWTRGNGKGATPSGPCIWASGVSGRGGVRARVPSHAGR
ncbi:hypothetical protein L1887_50626 [Cichorium endivia]|nr:hypothetical protein L1887_50626 [Cichorium endivia]